MTVCPKCNGRGTVGYFHIDHFVDVECDRCNGSGEVSEVEMTNEEYLKSCDTEQLAEWLANVINTNPCGYLLDCNECSLNDKCKEDDYPTSAEAWVEWLKQPHK